MHVSYKPMQRICAFEMQNSQVDDVYDIVTDKICTEMEMVLKTECVSCKFLK